MMNKEEREMLEEIKDTVHKIDTDVAVMREHLKNQGTALQAQMKNCNSISGVVFAKIEDNRKAIEVNDGFRNRMLGAIAALGSLSILAAALAIMEYLHG